MYSLSSSFRLAPLRVSSATSCQQCPECSVLGQVDCFSPWQPSEWSVLGQVDCFSPWQSVGVEVILHRLHPGNLPSPHSFTRSNYSCWPAVLLKFNCDRTRYLASKTQKPTALGTIISFLVTKCNKYHTNWHTCAATLNLCINTGISSSELKCHFWLVKYLTKHISNSFSINRLTNLQTAAKDFAGTAAAI